MAFKLLKEMMDGEFTFDTSAMGQEEPNPAAGVFSKETEDHPDVVTMDVPTLIRIMEWSHEDAQDDVQLHQFANALIQASFQHEEPLCMDDYEAVVSAIGGAPAQATGGPVGATGDQANDEVVYNN